MIWGSYYSAKEQAKAQKLHEQINRAFEQRRREEAMDDLRYPKKLDLDPSEYHRLSAKQA